MLYIVFIIIPLYYIYIINNSKNIINRFNNNILEQKAEIIKINNICESLLLTNINNDNLYINDYYVNFIIILVAKDLVICIIIIIIDINSKFNNNINIIASLLTIILISFIIVSVIYNYLFKNYINENIVKFDNIEAELNNKKDVINNINKNKVFSIIDSNINITYIDNSIDEYISNYQYVNKYDMIYIKTDLFTYHIKKNKAMIIFELKEELIKNKTKELIKTDLKNNNLITPEEVKKNLDDYKKSLELKINELIGLCQMNDLIINFN